MSSSSPTQPRPEFLPWTTALPAAVAEWLVGRTQWTGQGPLDLQSFLVVVPTRRAGRALRETLARIAHEKNQAAFPPQVVMPEALPGVLAELPTIAHRGEVLMAWIRTLREVDWEHFRSVLPVDPPRRDFVWARGLAQRLMRVQRELADEGLRMADVAAAEELPEQRRWQQLAELENRMEQCLAAQGLHLRAAAERVGQGAAALPAGVKEVVIAGAPDLPAVARRYLGVLAEQGDAPTVLVWAPSNMAAGFDAWGRPEVDVWKREVFTLKNFSRQVRLEPDPTAMARRVADIAAAGARPDEWLSLGMVDSEMGPTLEVELAQRKVPYFVPDGRPWTQGALPGLLEALGELATAPTLAAVGALLRHPDVLTFLARQSKPVVTDALLSQWDKVMAEHLPQTLADMQSFAAVAYGALARALEITRGWVDRLHQGEFAREALAIPAEVYAHQSWSGSEVVAESARHWTESVALAERAARVYPELNAGEFWRLALDCYAEGARFENKPAGALELGGWLELLWADAPRLMIAGLNDGHVPEHIRGDAFLPENLRQHLGLKSNEQREARDTYVLAAVTGLRPGANDVEILVAKTTAAGEPLQPSRLLLAAPDDELPDRVRHLFGDADNPSASLPWQRAWAMTPPRRKTPDHISVTGLRDWLDCPYRFYLSRVLKMEAAGTGKVELDAMDFGNLVHYALEMMGRDLSLRDCTDPNKLRDKLLAEYDDKARRDYGAAPSLPLRIQLESGRQRLRRAAMVQAQLQAEGWRIDKVETDMKLSLNSYTVTGKIDRIDRHEDGRVRVIDYKTSDQPKPPVKAHLEPERDGDKGRPDWLFIDWGRGKRKRWADLQIPLYRLYLKGEYGDDLECAYFNLPKAVGETGLSFWPPDAPELWESATVCAEGVVAAILAGEFWPPVERVEKWGDDWAGVFHDGAAASVAPGWIQEGAR